ncbi:MAG TPA: YfjI family protein [Gemmataceae bacterium]|nr:YfjI family protein [Gemmataceae bacterium]
MKKRKTLADSFRGAPSGQAEVRSTTPDAWTEPIPFDAARNMPPFPTHLLPAVLCEWIEAEAKATQTPTDLAGTLALSICGAALAGKIRVVVRDGWTEPVNIFTVVALPPGERKSIVHRHAMAPVVVFEKEEQERMAPQIAEAQSEHRTMEARLKFTEQKAAKAKDATERQQLRQEAKQLAKELAAHVVPEPPQMFCDDVTPEALGRLLAKQGGRMLQASPEGTAFEIVKGRYAETPNFDVYLKGHAGDPLRVGRIGREGETVDLPALSVALAVQPDVMQGLAEQTILLGRGFLARWLNALPLSNVGNRLIAARPVPKAIEAAYREAVLRLWRLEGAVEDNKPAAHLLRFSAEADRTMQDFERWLEPQLAEGEDLSLLAGWANKLAGAAARIAGSLHVMEALSTGQPCSRPIGAQTVAAAIKLARDYFLPHAQAAFALMGADGKIADARHVWVSIARRRNEFSECSENGASRLSRRDIHQWNRRRFPTVEALDPILTLLVDRCYIRPIGGTGQAGRGHASPTYEVNPLALAAFENEAPRTHCTQRRHSDPEAPASECSECSESAPPRSTDEIGNPCDVEDDDVNPLGKGDAYEGD